MRPETESLILKNMCFVRTKSGRQRPVRKVNAESGRKKAVFFFLYVLFLLPHYCPAQDTVSIIAGFMGKDGCNRSMDLKMDTLTIHMRGDTSVTLAMLYYIDSTDEYFNWGGTIYPKVISQSICIVVDGIVVGGKHLDSLPIDKHAKIKEGIQRLPIIDISLYKGNDSNYYFILYGAALCCGMECPEYFGVFDSKGTLLYEVIAANNYQYDKHFKSFDDFCRCKGVDEKSPLKKRSFY